VIAVVTYVFPARATPAIATAFVETNCGISETQMHALILPAEIKLFGKSG
jgi:hypothetical protein